MRFVVIESQIKFKSTSNRLFIYFKTDEDNELKGFRIKYEIILHTCGQEITILNEKDYLENVNSGG